MMRGTDGPDGKEMTSASHLEIGHPVYTLGTGAGMNSIKKTPYLYFMKCLSIRAQFHQRSTYSFYARRS